MINDEREDFLEAFQRATAELKLCPNRIWAVARENLPKLLPKFSHISSPHKQNGPYNEENDHQSCTFDFCEYSQRDFTAVQQRHECKDDSCTQLQGLFPRETLNNAAASGGLTVWKLSGDAILSPSGSYMAISHVWSDGTGAGTWQDGTVNECLYTFFRGIAERFSCDGIWWDTICIPREKAARNKAIQNIQSNYQDARITLVHDCFLRNWRWDPETACFAILISPWFSRGWTALELAKSRKVKVIFRGISGPIIKDLDEEILAKDDEPDGPRKEASRIIQNLRRNITSLNDLLTVLNPRYTSWPKDMAIISALLVGVAPEEKQQAIYRNILRKIGRLSHGHFFHNSATMSEEFGWCPTSLFKIPLDFSSEPCLTIHDDGVHGRWRLKQADEQTEENCSWVGSHPLIRQMLGNALKYPLECCLLAKCGTEPVKEALLVKKAQGIYYDYIGALFFRQNLPPDTGHWIETEVIISNLGITKEEEVKYRLSGSMGHMHLSGERNIQQNEGSEDTSSSEVEIFRRAIWRGDQTTVAKLSGKPELYVPDSHGLSPLHLAAERGDEPMAHLLLENSDVNLRSKNGRTALHQAAWSGSLSVVKLLLDNGSAPLAPDKDENLALHVAAQMGFKPIFQLLRRHTSRNAMGCNGLTPLHYAMINKHTSMAILLLKKLAKVTVKDVKLGWTPLHCAAGVGDVEVVKRLIARGAEVNSKDRKVGWTPLHLAAINGHNGVMRLLMENEDDLKIKDNYGWTPERFSRFTAHMRTANLRPRARPRPSKNSDIPKRRIPWTMLHCMAVNNPDELFKFLARKRRRTVFYGQARNWLPLLYCAKHGLRTAIEWLLHEGHDPEQKDSTGRTALSLAAMQGHAFIVKMLLRSGANVDAKDRKHSTPISWAARGGHFGVVEILLDKGARITELKKDRLPPLVWAARMGHVPVVEVLLGRGANIEGWPTKNSASADGWVDNSSDESSRGKNSRGKNSRGKSSRGKNFREVSSSDESSSDESSRDESSRDESSRDKISRDESSRDENSSDESSSDESFRDESSRDENSSDESSSDENSSDESSSDDDDSESNYDYGLSPLSWAAKMGHEAVIELLLRRGAGIDGRDLHDADNADVLAPLECAARVGNLKIVRLLLSKGASVEGKNCDEGFPHMTPLGWAARMGHLRIVKVLVSQGANIERESRRMEENYGFMMPLSWAAKMGHETVVDLLLKKGANIEGGLDQPQDDMGGTPLQWAAQEGHTSIVELLLQRGANVKGQTWEGECYWNLTPLSLAERMGHTTIVEILLQNGANIEGLVNQEDRRKMKPRERRMKPRAPVAFKGEAIWDILRAQDPMMADVYQLEKYLSLGVDNATLHTSRPRDPPVE